MSATFVCLVVSICVGLIFALLGIGLLSGGFNAIVNAVLHSKYQVTPGSEVENIWKNTPLPMYMRVYPFNLTNPDEFLKGEIPVLNEIGPYVYREYHHKENVTYHPNMTVTYYQKRNWTFDEELSKGLREDDQITMLNIIPVGAAYAVENNPIMLERLNKMMKLINEKTIVTAKASEIIFDGYQDPLLNVTQKAWEDGLEPPGPSELKMYDKFAWFYKRNNSVTHDGIYNMFTGESGFGDVGMIDWWNYARNTTHFDPPCNEVNGSAGDLWPPGLSKDKIRFFISDLCMTATLYYKKEIEDSFGTNGYRYWGSNMTFANSTYLKENECFCVNNICAPTGLLNAETCRIGAPAYISFPHFFNADPDLLNYVEGLNPNAENHSFYIDINPVLGVPLQVAARIQINIKVKSYPGKVENLESVPDVILPMIWFEVISGITEELSDNIRTANWLKSSAVPKILLGILAAIGLILAASLLALLCKKKKKKQASGKCGDKKLNDKSSSD
ncbi:UNVERIFIED_CONTAM: hypothetical protein RMT77_013614 [Armadillidium vulgare]